MIKWEYKVDEYFNFFYADSDLNSAGRDGWELVGIYKDQGKTYAIFKRPKE